MVPQLQRMLMKRHWLNRPKQNEIIACAVSGLRKARTPAALEALQKAQEKRKGSEMEGLISRALKELEAVSDVPLASGESHE